MKNLCPFQKTFSSQVQVDCQQVRFTCCHIFMNYESLSRRNLLGSKRTIIRPNGLQYVTDILVAIKTITTWKRPKQNYFSLTLLNYCCTATCWLSLNFRKMRTISWAVLSYRRHKTSSTIQVDRLSVLLRTWFKDWHHPYHLGAC